MTSGSTAAAGLTSNSEIPSQKQNDYEYKTGNFLGRL